ncbi:MAG: HAD hydrolase-like protein [Candidatus Kapabacteria bacterium]|jgi:phosphoglycolate phosphatase|nr:HAD hydrolase-like protein [Candidatus Kapabacteria bacterium]
MKKLVLFDIDGTLLKFKKYRSKEFFAQVIDEIFGTKPDIDKMPSFAGMTDSSMLRVIADDLNISHDEMFSHSAAIWSKLLALYKEFTTEDIIEILPGVEDLLMKLEADKDIALGLVTGNFRAHAYLKLDTVGLGYYFKFGAYGDDNYDRDFLPPLLFRRAAEYLKVAGFSASDALIIGDSPKDIQCAKVNGIPVLSVATGGFSTEELAEFQPNDILNDLSDSDAVYSLIRKMLGMN